MRVLVCGGRDYHNEGFIRAALDQLRRQFHLTEVLHGGAKGADKLAGRWAKSQGIPDRVFHADWQKDGKAAGPIRNQRMLDEGKPELVVAFPGGRGTADMVARAKRAHVRIFRYTDTSDGHLS